MNANIFFTGINISTMNIIYNYPKLAAVNPAKKTENFSGNNNDDTKCKVQQKNSCRNSIAAYLISGAAALYGLSACTENNPSGAENHNNIRFEYYNVKPHFKDSVAAPVLRLKSRIPKEENFLDNLEIDITNDIKNLNDSNSFRRYIKRGRVYGYDEYMKGVSFYSDKKLPRIIIVQEQTHRGDNFLNYFISDDNVEISALKQTVMHEIGHQFDEYYGHDHNAELAQKWDSILYSKEKDPCLTPYSFCCYGDANQIDTEYHKNNDLSDKKEFHDAMLTDINNIKNINKKDLPCNIHYYVSTSDIDKIWTANDVEQAEHTRTEVYANLFSYALCEDEGEREKFIKCFPKCYDVVKKDISKYLKIEL